MAALKKKSAKAATDAIAKSTASPAANAMKAGKAAATIRTQKKVAKPAKVDAGCEAKPFAGLIDVGAAAPAFRLPDQTGTTHTLSQYAGQWVVIYFYPKDDTPGCTVEACGFRDSSAAFKKRGAAVLGVSPDDAKSHAKFIAKYKLPFTLLADTEQVMCKAYGVWQEKSMYGRRYMGVARTTYLIDPQGHIAARWDKVKAAGHEQDVLAKMDAVR